MFFAMLSTAILLLFTKLKIRKLYLLFALVIIIVSLALAGSLIPPKNIYDLYRHYELIDYIRYSNCDVFKGTFFVIPMKYTNYSFTYVFNILICLIAKFLPNQALPFITILICYSVYAYILLKESRVSSNSVAIIVSFFLFSILQPYLYIYSGIRCTLSASFAALAFYRFFKVKKNIFLTAFLELCAVLIHPFALATVPLYFIFMIKPNFIFLFLVFIIPRILAPVMEWCRLKSGNQFLFLLGAKYYNYTNVREDFQGIVFYTASLLPLIILTLLLAFKSFNYKKKAMFIEGNSSFSRKLHINHNWLSADTLVLDNTLTSLWFYMIVSFAFIDSYSVFTRFPYFISYFSPAFVKYIYLDQMIRKRYKPLELCSLIILISLYVLVTFENISWLLF